MAKSSTVERNRSGGNPWMCHLTVFPSPARQDDRLILTVTLSCPSQKIGDIPPALNRGFYENFTYQYESNHLALSELLSRHANGTTNPAILPNTDGVAPGSYEIKVTVTPQHPMVLETLQPIEDLTEEIASLFTEPLPTSADVTIVARPSVLQANVTLQRSESAHTNDQALWAAIRNRTAAVGFDRYERFIGDVFSDGSGPLHRITLDGAHTHPPLNVFGPHAYHVLKLATQAFLTLECGVRISDHYHDHEMFEAEKEDIRQNDPDVSIQSLTHRLKHYLSGEPAALPYLNRIVRAFVSLHRDDADEKRSYFDTFLRSRLEDPSLIELIWSYWHEQGMLVQTMNAIAWRFQNRRAGPNDPLGELEFDTLRPLSNMIWGYIQDEHNRLTVPRRASEYRHHYGLTLEGRAVPNVEPADNRSKFIEAFHNLLYRTDRFYREDRDTTMIADAFPLLNALKEVHLLLAEGMHNQYGDLTWTARAEMLTMQWMLSRAEMREFLRGRYAVPYQESWMGAVDSMKRLQGWIDTSITHFHELAVTGERILLSIRFSDWSNIHNIEEQAKNWARNSKPEVQRYMFCYQTVTGVDLTAETTDTSDAGRRFLQPSALLRRRLLNQKTPPLIAGARPQRLIEAQGQAFGALPAPRLTRLAKSNANK